MLVLVRGGSGVVGEHLVGVFVAVVVVKGLCVGVGGLVLECFVVFEWLFEVFIGGVMVFGCGVDYSLFFVCGGVWCKIVRVGLVKGHGCAVWGR